MFKKVARNISKFPLPPLINGFGCQFKRDCNARLALRRLDLSRELTALTLSSETSHISFYRGQTSVSHPYLFLLFLKPSNFRDQSDHFPSFNPFLGL